MIVAHPGDRRRRLRCPLRLDPIKPDSLYGRGICQLRADKARAGNRDIDAANMLSYGVADQSAHYGASP